MRIGPLGAPEILIILILVLLVFGARRLPEMAKSIGQSVREFRKGIKDMQDDIERDDEDQKGKKRETFNTATVENDDNRTREGQAV